MSVRSHIGTTSKLTNTFIMDATTVDVLNIARLTVTYCFQHTTMKQCTTLVTLMTFAEERESEADLKETTKETVVEVAKQQSKSKSQVKGKCKRLNGCYFPQCQLLAS